MANEIPQQPGWLWAHPLPSTLWPERYGGWKYGEPAAALAVTDCAAAWRRTDPAAVANILRGGCDVLDVASVTAHFMAQQFREDTNPPAIANWLREQARQELTIRQRQAHLFGTDWDDGGTPEQHMLADLDMIHFSELIAADNEHGVIRFVSRSGLIDKTPVWGSASCGTRLLARLWPPQMYTQIRETFGGAA